MLSQNNNVISKYNRDYIKKNVKIIYKYVIKRSPSTILIYYLTSQLFYFFVLLLNYENKF